MTGRRRSSTSDVSRRSCSGDASLPEQRRVCGWCGGDIPAGARIDSITCSRKCRQSRFRFLARGLSRAPADEPARFAYADPPYPGTASKYYKDEPTFAGEVNHAELVERLCSGGYDGWALSTSARALRDVLQLCPPGARVCPWVKPIGASPNTYGPHNCWEPLIVVGGRFLRGGVRDWLRAQPARGGGELPGRKPASFCAWLFDLLGMQPGDELDDLFPGTGIVLRAWRVASLASRSTEDVGPACASLEDLAEPSLEASDDASLSAEDDASLRSSTTLEDEI